MSAALPKLPLLDNADAPLAPNAAPRKGVANAMPTLANAVAGSLLIRAGVKDWVISEPIRLAISSASCVPRSKSNPTFRPNTSAPPPAKFANDLITEGGLSKNCPIISAPPSTVSTASSAALGTRLRAISFGSKSWVS